jgi:hypothetical protein
MYIDSAKELSPIDLALADTNHTTVTIVEISDEINKKFLRVKKLLGVLKHPQHPP